MIRANRARALMLAKRELALFVTDAVQLEGIYFTLPEVQTLMEGITVGGHRLSDQKIATNQIAAWQRLFAWLADSQFSLCAKTACALHAIAAEEEALSWGCFRDSGVTIAGTDYCPPPAAQLPDLFEQMCQQAKTITDIYDQAIFVFLTMARNQFFFDVNKRMGRFMMNGLLLDAGYPAINLPAKRKQAFNENMLAFYQSGDMQAMNQFMRDCLDSRLIKIMNES